MTRLPGLLVELEDTWLRKGMPHTRWLASGLSEAEIRRKLQAHELHIPAEIVEWYSWHDGIDAHVESDVRPFLGPSKLQPLSLALAIGERSGMIEVAEYQNEIGHVPDEDQPIWESEWLPIARDLGGGLLTADLTQADRETVRMRIVDWEGADFKRVNAESLADVVEFWLGALNSYCVWSAEDHDWEYDFASLPLEIRQRDLL